jgi:hypothetical protein
MDTEKEISSVKQIIPSHNEANAKHEASLKQQQALNSTRAVAAGSVPQDKPVKKKVEAPKTAVSTSQPPIQ